MIRRLAALLAPVLALSLLAFAPARAAGSSVPPGAAPPPPPGLQQLVVSGGCFWCMEHDLKLPGVVGVESGYTGGHVDRPTYEQVVGESTGHVEAVRVLFDPKRTSYGYLLSRYWKLIDPTDDGGQFCDRGPSYRSAVFVADADQRRQAEQSRVEAARQLKRGTIKTPILPLGPFWPAESYHRNYAQVHKNDYAAYRQGCGRDDRLAQVWGGPRPAATARPWWSLF